MYIYVSYVYIYIYIFICIYIYIYRPRGAGVRVRRTREGLHRAARAARSHVKAWPLPLRSGWLLRVPRAVTPLGHLCFLTFGKFLLMQLPIHFDVVRVLHCGFMFSSV